MLNTDYLNTRTMLKSVPRGFNASMLILQRNTFMTTVDSTYNGVSKWTMCYFTSPPKARSAVYICLDTLTSTALMWTSFGPGSLQPHTRMIAIEIPERQLPSSPIQNHMVRPVPPYPIMLWLHECHCGSSIKDEKKAWLNGARAVFSVLQKDSQ